MNDPHAWMKLPASEKPVPPKVEESARQWYQRTTSGARKFLVYASLVAVCIAVCVFIFAPKDVHHALQQFNGAYTIPVAALIWILGFVYIFLIPQREVGFRSQEFIESLSNTITNSIQQELVPAVRIWKRLGLEIEKNLPGMVHKVNAGLEEIRGAVVKLNQAVEKNDNLAAEAKPAIEALKRIEAKVEEEIQAGLFRDMRSAIESVRGIAGVPKGQEEAHDLSFALNSIRKNKQAGRTP